MENQPQTQTKPNYQNTETKKTGGMKIIRKVNIRNGKGYKSVSTYKRNKRIFTVKKPLCNENMQQILSGKFIPGLFHDCR